MLVSIIVPIYNKEQYIEKLIKSLINQTYKKIEIILINDGSSDNSKKICENFAQEDSRIIVCSQQNLGVSQARNKGIDIAKGKYITFIDADDYVKKYFIEDMIKNIEEDSIVNVNWNSNNSIVNSDEYLKKVISGKILGVCWGYLLDTKIVKNIKFDINTSYMEDTIFMVQYINRVSRIKLINNQSYCHIQNNDSLTANVDNIYNKINGYIYSINKIKEISEKYEKESDYFERVLQKRKIKIIEAEFAKIENEDEIKKIINNPNVKDIRNQKKIELRYKVFVYLLNKGKNKDIYKYIKFRRKLKSIKERIFK